MTKNTQRMLELTIAEILWIQINCLFVRVLWHINLCRLFNAKSILYKYKVLFQTIQFSISTQFSFIWPIDRTLLGATTPGQSEPGSNSNKEVFCIPQSSNITGTLPSNCLVLYPEHLLEVGVWPHCRKAVDVFYSPSQLGKNICQDKENRQRSIKQTTNMA